MNNDFKGGFEKTAGLFSSVDDLAKAAKNVSEDGAEFIHKMDKDQYEGLLKAVEKLKPSIKPAHLLLASALAGAGFPLGQYVGTRAKDVTKAVLESPQPKTNNFGDQYLHRA